MFRAFFALCLAALIGGAAWAATGLQAERHKVAGRVGLVLLVALQR